MTDVNAILAERATTHGDYTHHAECTQYLKSYFRSWSSWDSLTPCQKETLEMVAHKIGRVLTGNPNHKDHWDDIAGYATLVSQRISVPPVMPKMKPFSVDLNKLSREVEDNALHGLADK